MGFGAGQIVYEDDLTDLKPFTVSKGLATARVNNTLADDPDLSAVTLSAGTWTIEANLYATFSGTAVGATSPQMRTRWAFTGTWGSPIRLCHGPGSSNVSTLPDRATPAVFRGYDAVTQDATYHFGVSTAYSAIKEEAYTVTISAEGDFSIQWAQVTTTAGTSLTLQANSTVKFTKIRD